MVHSASMATTRMSLSHSSYLQCCLKIRYIHGALRSGYKTMNNAQCNNATIQRTTFFELGVYRRGDVGISSNLIDSLSLANGGG